jgi:Tol biopolymer transport system component
MAKTFFKKKLVITIAIILLLVSVGTITVSSNVISSGNSSDNGKIIFGSDRSGNWDLWMMNVDGSELTQLTTDEGPDITPDLSPDGKKIAFISGRTGYPQPWILDLAYLMYLI